MANHDLPTLTSTYTNFVSELDGRLDDLAKGMDPAVTTVTNPPTNSIRWNSANKKWEKWSGTAWNELSANYAINLQGPSTVSANSTGDALRITQTGAGNALVVEDSANPDSTPFVIDASGNVGIGTSSPTSKLHLAETTGATEIFESTETSLSLNSVIGEIQWKQNDASAGGTGIATRIKTIAENRPDTGAFFGTSSRLGFFVSGAPEGNASTNAPYEALSIRSNGNVGIGTNSPTTTGNYRVAEIKSGDATSGGMLILSTTDNAGSARLYSTSTQCILDDGGSTSDIYIKANSGNNVIFGTNNTERLRIDASGNVGIGTSLPSAKFAFGIGDTISEIGRIGFDVAGNQRAYVAANRHTAIGQLTDLSFGTMGSERTRIDSSGNLLVGVTAVPSGSVGGAGFIRETASRSSLWLASTTTSSANLAAFFNPNGTVGAIATSGTSTSYLTSSDYRLKYDIAPMQGALARVQQLKPVTYKWNADNSDGEGFIAHELAEVCPQAVTGEKDSIDTDGKPIYQGIDTSFLVATLVAAIQEQQLMITDLNSRIEALESVLPK